MKKLLSVLLVCALMLVCVSSLAEGISSKGSTVPSQVKGDIPVKDINTLKPEEKEQMENAFNTVIASMYVEGATIADVFGKDVASQLNELSEELAAIGVDFDVENMVIQNVEPFVFDVSKWDGKSAVEQSIKIDQVNFTEGEAVVVLVGVVNGDETEWNPTVGLGNAEGGVDVEYSAELMAKIKEAGGKTIIAFGTAE